MGYRVDKVSVYMNCNIEFLGAVSINFDFVPNPDDPKDAALVAALVAKNDAQNLAAAKLAGMAGPMDVA